MARNCNNCDFCTQNGGDLACVNEDSEYFTDYVEPNYVCDEWFGSEDGECE